MAVSLKKYVDASFKAQGKAVAAALAAADRASVRADAATEKRFDGVNEFRKALDDNARLLIPRLEAEQSFRILAEKITELTNQMNARDNRSRGLSTGWGYLIGAIGLISLIVSIIYELTRSHV